MARNEDLTLTITEAARVALYESKLAVIKAGEPMTVVFTKRDGTARTISGEYVETKGNRSDHSVVVVDTDAGPRSANLFLTHSISTSWGTVQA